MNYILVIATQYRSVMDRQTDWRTNGRQNEERVNRNK